MTAPYFVSRGSIASRRFKSARPFAIQKLASEKNNTIRFKDLNKFKLVKLYCSSSGLNLVKLLGVYLGT
jgi:hypothetical protein